MDYDKRLYWLLTVIITVSAVVIGATSEVDMIFGLRSFHLWSIGLAMLFLTVGMYFDCTRLIRLVRMSGYDITLRQSLTVILSNYFLAMLTPGATGGPVAQVLVLRKLQVPTGCASVLVLVRTILSIVFLIVCVPAVLWLDAELIAGLPIESIMAAAVGAVILLLIGIESICTRRMKRLVLRVTVLCAKARRQAIWRAYRQVTVAIGFLHSHPRAMLRVFADTALSLLFLYAIVPALFLGLDADVDWVLVMGRMILLNLVLYFAPTPGGTGIAEGGFVYLFGGLVPSGTVGVLAVIWRMLAEYLPFVCGMYVTLKLFGKKSIATKIAGQDQNEDGGFFLGRSSEQ